MVLLGVAKGYGTQPPYLYLILSKFPVAFVSLSFYKVYFQVILLIIFDILFELCVFISLSNSISLFIWIPLIFFPRWMLLLFINNLMFFAKSQLGSKVKYNSEELALSPNKLIPSLCVG